MLSVIKRVLGLSGDLSKRIYGSFVFSFIDAILGMFPLGAVFYALMQLQSGTLAGKDWSIMVGILASSLIGRMVFKYLVYS